MADLALKSLNLIEVFLVRNLREWYLKFVELRLIEHLVATMPKNFIDYTFHIAEWAFVLVSAAASLVMSF